MVDLWKQEPYWWLHSDELIAACRGSSNIKDFWFKLWHALDKWKTDANRRKHRIHAAHDSDSVDDSWPPPSWPDHQEDHWQHQCWWTSTMAILCLCWLHNGQLGQIPSVSLWHTTTRPNNHMTNISWFATTNGRMNPFWLPLMDKHFAAATTGGDMPQIQMLPYKLFTMAASDLLPILMRAMSHIIGARVFFVGLMEVIFTVPFTWTPMCRSVLQQFNIPVAIPSWMFDHTSFTTWPNAVKSNIYDFLLHAGVPAEYTASLYFDVIHGHEKRWRVRSHLASIMGFSV